jgi:hypothetical protein
MFCPICGRENPSERKFCSSCGTNLEAVSHALSGSSENFFSTFDAAMDRFLARYSERVFKDAPSGAGEAGVGRSWRILGQGFVTSLVDMILVSIMWNILPLRFLMLVIMTPFSLLSRRSNRQKIAPADTGQVKPIAGFNDGAPARWLPGAFPSVTENTTDIFPGRREARTEAQGMGKTE